MLSQFFFEKQAIDLALKSERVFLDNAQEPRLLEGIPFAIKEEFAFKNSCRSSSSKIFKDRIDNYTDVYIQRLLDQGSIPLFKTTTPEFCLLGTTWSDLHGIQLIRGIKNILQEDHQGVQEQLLRLELVP